MIAEGLSCPRWYALRVSARRPSIGAARRLGLVAHGPQPVVPPAGAAGGERGARQAEVPHLPLRAEYVVEALLARRGIEAWVPVESVYARANRYHRRARRLVVHPMLTGYVLVRMLPGGPWARVLSVPLVVGVVGIGGLPLAMPDAAIARMREAEAGAQADEQQRLMPTRRVYAVGDPVEVLDGPLAGQVMRVVGIEGDLARVVGPLFGGEVEAAIAVDRIGAVR